MSWRQPSEGELRRGERATWGRAPAGRPRMRLVSWRAMRKNSLRGFASIQLPIGLTIHDIPVLLSGGRAWATLPLKPQIDGDGRHKRDAATGKPAYSPILAWRDPELKNRFSEAVVALVRGAHPGEIEDDGRL